MLSAGKRRSTDSLTVPGAVCRRSWTDASSDTHRVHLAADPYAGRGKVLTHETLLYTVWGSGYHEEVDYIRVYLHTLRLKLEDDPRHPTYLETIMGVGYWFRQLCTILQ